MMLYKDDPARAANRTRQEVTTRGAVFNINEGIEIEDDKDCVTRLVGWPGVGTRMVSFHLLTHKKGGYYETHRHPASEDSMICLRGQGEVNLGRGWVAVEAGNAIIVPRGCEHATRNSPDAVEDFVVLSYNCPPPMEYYQRIGMFADGNFSWGAIDVALLATTVGQVPKESVMKLNEFGGNERGELKGAAEVARSGGVFNVFRGAPFTGNGGLMKFVLWPGAGAVVGQHTAFHDPGEAFVPHVHPISEDAIFIFDGKGTGYLESRWIEVSEGDIIYAPAGIRHGTGCRSSETKTMICTGCAFPPQFDLYERAGYLKGGKFVDFPIE
jgi:quercetin dioxygenase-like cupin family protein